MIDYPQTLQVVQELLERHDRAGLLYGIPESEVVARIRPTLPRFIGAMLEETYGSGPNPGTEGPKSW